MYQTFVYEQLTAVFIDQSLIYTHTWLSAIQLLGLVQKQISLNEPRNLLVFFWNHNAVSWEEIESNDYPWLLVINTMYSNLPKFTEHTYIEGKGEVDKRKRMDCWL